MVKDNKLLLLIMSFIFTIFAFNITTPVSAEGNTYNSLNPGKEWRDTNGEIIQAHGGGIMYDEKTETYYWYGEDKTNGYLPATGVHAYSSKDLYNWKDEGVVMKAIEKREDMDTDPYLIDVYKNRSAAEKDVIFSDINSARGVLERPKVIYNEKTDKYVLWLHVDGPYEGSDSNYAKAKAGVAISDSPTGPFEYLESNRLNKMPEGYEYKVRNTGMSRDMNLFVDDDGTGYIIYSSEENYSLYISKLNEDYTAIAGEEYGKDFIRAIYNGHREAPAMFKYDGKYYLITSGATGWDPNPARYHVADSVLGEWTDMGNPVLGDGASTTHGSQSTYVLPVDPENGKFIYMGDRWNSKDLKNSRYIWMPIEFGQEDEMVLNWYDEWSLDILDRMGKVTINTDIPNKVLVGETPNLPSSVNVTTPKGGTFDTPVTWSYDTEEFSKLGTVIVKATFPELLNKVLNIKIAVVPPVNVGELELNADVLLYGDQYTLTTTITNNTEKDKEITVNADVPNGWKIEPMTLQVDSLDSKDITIPVIPADDGVPTIFNLNVTANYEDKEVENGVEIVAIPKVEHLAFALDAGTSTSTVFGDYDPLSPNEKWDSDKGYGWIGTVPDSRDRGVVDSLRKDLIASYNPATLGLSIPAGYHTVYVISGDRQYGQGNTMITVDGTKVAETGGTAQGQFKVLSFGLDGGASGRKVDLEFTGEAGKHWVFNALMVKKDKTAPTIHAIVNGKVFDETFTVMESENVTFTWEAKDNESGIAEVSASFDGEVYTEGTNITLTGKLGEHHLKVKAVDKAGNVKESSYVINVTTSAADMQILVDRFEEGGEFANHGAARSLKAHLHSVDHFVEKNEMEKAIHHMENFKQVLDHHKGNKLISEKVYHILNSSSNYLLEKW
ncbi:FIMAH domain-containing protein [Metabacillus halosaccharovorans]|uniref:FIMAH domain-containing protein n=1 Tax=Metabacillus halosaccharovorans TaxID=930124 RepID=UPI002040142F|nr:family 43 glycosylhydrolase [Metabacillus halosaccharovorans]MCM3443648.1 family 43 glycosylhydrolase [Metabacillus halosaccharovorans]